MELQKNVLVYDFTTFKGKVFEKLQNYWVETLVQYPERSIGIIPIGMISAPITLIPPKRSICFAVLFVIVECW